MSRYIDRELALSHPFANGEYDHKNANEDFILGIESYKEWLEQLPTGDVVEVVRCEGCIFSKRDMDVHPDPKILNKDRWCELYGKKSPDWFCADGKRREDV